MRTVRFANQFCFLVLVLGSTCTAVLRSQDNSNTFRAGAVSFNFPAPDKDLVEAGPDYRVVLEPLAPVSNRLVAAFVLPDALTVLHSGVYPPLHDYAMIEVPRRAEFAEITPEIFKQIEDGVAQQFAGDLSGTIQEQQDEANRRLKALGSTASVTLDKPVMLGALFSKENVTSYGMVMPVSTKDGTVKMAMAMNVIRVRNRVVFGYLYTLYKDESTANWLKTTAAQWADAILNANK